MTPQAPGRTGGQDIGAGTPAAAPAAGSQADGVPNAAAAARAAVRPAGAAADGLAARRAATAARGPVHAGAHAGALGAAGGCARVLRPAPDPQPVAERAAGARAGKRTHALVGGGWRARGGGCLRRRPDDLPLPADHRHPRPGLLCPVRVLDRPPRLTADPAGALGVRRHPPCAQLHQPSLLPGRHRTRAAVHGGAADGPRRRFLDRRRGNGGRPGTGAGRMWGAHLRWPGCPARRAAVGAAGRPGPGGLAAAAVHQPVDLQ